MRKADFLPESSGELVETVDGALAFVPQPLPPKIEWDDALVSVVSDAQASLGRLAGMGARFPHPERLIRMFLRREAEYSSRIERTYAGVRTLVLFDFIDEIEEKSPSAREVENNFRLLQFVCDAIPRGPITLALLRQMQAMLFNRVESPPKVVGDFRKLQNWIGMSGDIHEARFVPAPPHRVRESLEALLTFMRAPATLPAIMRAAMTHYQFECLHPFDDGNGRVGRALVLAQLMQDGSLPIPLLNPSAQLEQHRREYYDLLLDVSLRGKWKDWIIYLSRCVRLECVRSMDILQDLDALRSRYMDQVQLARHSALLAKVIDHLFGDPAVTAKGLATVLKITPQSALRVIDKLLKAQILCEVTGQQRNRVYLAEDIVDIFSREHGNNKNDA